VQIFAVGKNVMLFCVNDRKKVSNEVEITMTWLIDDLNDLKENFPRTIIYCNSITDAYISSRILRRHE
jgi:hypothetical protein